MTSRFCHNVCSS